MIDTSHVDLVALAGVPLRRKGKQMVGACPICRDGHDRFFVDTSKNAWGCRFCTKGSYRDALHFVAMRDGLDLQSREGFKTALEELRIDMPAQPLQQREQRPQNPIPSMRHDYASFSAAWQKSAGDFVMQSLQNMRTKAGLKAQDYLCGRGLEPAVIGSAELGYNPETYKALWGEVEVYLPRGIVIPWEMHVLFKYSRVRVRTGGNADKKYRQAAGAANGLYYAMPITPKSYVVLVEGEFDALALRSECIRHARATGNSSIHRVAPVATGGTTQGRVMRHVVELSIARRVLVAFDNDDNGAGDVNAQWWLDRLKNAVRWKPTYHDVNDMVTHGGDVVDWLREGLQQ